MIILFERKIMWETDEDIDRESERDKDSGREGKILRER